MALVKGLESILFYFFYLAGLCLRYTLCLNSTVELIFCPHPLLVLRLYFGLTWYLAVMFVSEVPCGIPVTMDSRLGLKIVELSPVRAPSISTLVVSLAVALSSMLQLLENIIHWNVTCCWGVSFVRAQKFVRLGLLCMVR